MAFFNKYSRSSYWHSVQYAFCGTIILLILSFPAHAAHDNDGAYDDTAHRDQIIQYIETLWVPPFLLMTEQFSVVMMHQAMIVGALLDVKMQLETQTVIQELEAQAHKDYQPEVEVCMIGTSVRSLAASETKAKTQARLMSEIMLDRETLSQNSIGGIGYSGDKDWRFGQFKTTFCDKNDNKAELQNICSASGGRENNDINYARIIDKKLTLNDVNFMDTTLTDEEEDIIALSRNLFSNDVFMQIPAEVLLQEYAQDDLQDIRSVIALRGLARNSFGHLVGMRTPGTEESAPFIKSIAQQLGIGRVATGPSIPPGPVTPPGSHPFADASCPSTPTPGVVCDQRDTTASPGRPTLWIPYDDIYSVPFITPNDTTWRLTFNVEVRSGYISCAIDHWISETPGGPPISTDSKTRSSFIFDKRTTTTPDSPRSNVLLEPNKSYYYNMDVVGCASWAFPDGPPSSVPIYLQWQIMDYPDPPGSGSGSGVPSQPNSELDQYLGEYPSYYAQMEVITKKMFQNPDFYTNLYTTPANADRIGIALQALRLMQNRDRFESSLRREMLISAILEVKLREVQEGVNRDMFGSTTKYESDPLNP